MAEETRHEAEPVAAEPSETAPLLAPGPPGAPDAAPVKSHGTFDDANQTARPPNGEAATEAANGDTNGHNGEEPAKPKASFIALLPALAIGLFLVAMDQTLTVATYGRIGSDLEALNSTAWVATSYFLTLTACQPLYGKLSDIFGRKECLLFAYSVFGIGCLGCALSQDILQICIARAVTGVGGGGMNAVVSILVTDLVPLRDRGLWQGYINVVFLAGLGSGGPIGGFLADTVGWRWAFAGQFPISILAFLCVLFILKVKKPDPAHWLEKFKRIDFLGAITLVSAVFLLLLGLDSGSNRGWDEKSTYIPLAIAPVMFVVFLLVEVYVASHPFAPGHVILHPPLLAAYLSNFFGVAAQMSVMFFVALWFQAAMGATATQSGVWFIPSTAFSLVGSLFGGLVLRRTGKFYWLIIIGWSILVLTVAPFVLLTGVYAKSSAAVVAMLPVLGFGASISITTLLVAIIANSEKEDMAIGIACSYLFRSMGTTVGVSISTSVLQQALRTLLASALESGGKAREIEEHVRQSLDYINELPPEVAEIVRRCYASATAYAFIPVAVFGVLAVISSIFIKEKKL